MGSHLRLDIDISFNLTIGVASDDRVIESNVRSEPTVHDGDTEQSSITKPTAFYPFIVNDAVTVAEVVWAMKHVMSHRSLNSAADEGDLFRLMFPDSSIATKFSMGST